MNRKLKQALTDPLIIMMFALTVATMAKDASEQLTQHFYGATRAEQRDNPMSYLKYTVERPDRFAAKPSPGQAFRPLTPAAP